MGWALPFPKIATIPKIATKLDAEMVHTLGVTAVVLYQANTD